MPGPQRYAGGPPGTISKTPRRCEPLISDLATDRKKREVFDRLAMHLTVLADQVEEAILQSKQTAT